MSFKQATVLIAGIGIAIQLHAQLPSQQLTDSLPSQVVSNKYLDVVSNKADDLERKLDEKSDKAFRQFQKQELRISSKLKKIDSLKAKEIYENTKQQYAVLNRKLQNSKLGQYLPSLDTISSSLKFLEQNPQFLATAKDAQEKLQQAMEKVKGMEEQFQKAEDIKKFLRERRQYLMDQLTTVGLCKRIEEA